MVENINAYIEANPGNLITAEDWNGMQTMIKEDIKNSIQKAEDKIKKEGVDKAGDADKFGGKTPTDWTKDLDQQYARIVHNHEGKSVSRKYFIRLSGKVPAVFLKHKLGAFPLVDTYELVSVFDQNLDGINVEMVNQVTSSDGKPLKFFLYSDHYDRDKYGMYTEVYGERVNLGIRMIEALKEYKVDWKENDSLVDVVQELWDRLFDSPNMEMSHAVSESIEKRYSENVRKLVKNDEWDDLYLAFRPKKCTLISCKQITDGGCEGTFYDLTPVPLKITHVNYDTLLLEIDPAYLEGKVVDIMILLRI